MRGGLSFNTYVLTVNKIGTGSGTVISNGNLINCGVICSYPFFDTTRVTLTATPDASYQFAGWSGGGCSGIGDCVVTMDAAKTVTATFDIPYPLTITNNGHGTIAGPNRCTNSSCENDYAGFITLTATPDTDYQFAGWSGDCSDASVICTIPMTEARNVSATFMMPSAGTGSSWQSITPAPTTNDLYSVAYGNGLFVAVGDTGVILNSTDGISWTTPTSVTGNMLNRVIWGGGQFVAVGESGTVLTSTNGSSWQVRRSSGVDLNDVTWGGNQFVAVGDSGTILTSSDGVTWTTRTSGTPNPLMGMTWSGSQFVAVGYSGTILTSSDGMTWTVRSSGTADALGDVIWSGSQFVAVGGTGTILTSPDGVTWTARTSGAGGFWLFGVTWNGNQFVVLVFDGAGTILTSPNGINWTPQTSGITNALSGMTWNGSQFVAVGNSGTILISPPIPQTLTVNKNGIGSGTITSNVGGIDCGATCNANINNGTLVTLTAASDSSSFVTSWTNCTPIATNQCQVTMDAAKTVTATFDLGKQLNVNFTGTGTVTVTHARVGTDCTTNCSLLYTNGSLVALNATPASGYSFTGWETDCTGTGICSLTMTANKTVTANFILNTYSITATANPTAGGSISCSPNPVTSGNTANCTATPNTGYALSNFSGDCSGTTCALTNVTAAKAVTANFTPLYSITATANPTVGGSVSCSPNPITSGGAANCTATANAGYTFNGFSGDCSGTTCAFSNVTANKTVTANFTGTYSITATANPIAGGSISCSPNPVTSGNTANCTATPNTGYTFANFSGDCTGSTCILTNVTANKTVTANFTATYSITATANPTAGGSISCSPNPVTSGNTANCTATPNTGYTFANFSGDCSGATCVLTNVTANKTVTANFTATYSITATANPITGGSISCSPNPVASGADANCTATPNAGYALSNFSGDCSGATCVLTNVTAVKAVTANFTPLYSITATANPIAGGLISCSPNPVASGADANCTATPNTGYALSNFSGDCSGATCALTNVTANKNVTANFTTVTYSITATTNPIAGGLISCSPNPVASGADANCTATPNAGYTFANFSGDCTGSTCVLTNVTANKTVTANFTATYSITATANPTAGGSISCSPNPVASGADANCTATPNTGYALSNFSGDCSGTTCILTNVTANKNVTANFTAITYSITAAANPIAGGSINCSPNPVASGADANCTATPNAGYVFTNFTGACTGTTCELTNVTANKNVTANFAANTYSITATANPSAGGSISCLPNPVASGADANCTATPNAGYVFTNFTGACTGTTCALTNVTAAKAVTANFTPLYSITATANPIAGGLISCLPNPVASGADANCTATPNAGYALSNFSGDCSGTTCALTNVTANKNVTANFTTVTYSITATANPIAGGSINCSPNPVTSGADANCTATPNAGYAFANFSGDCSGAACALTNVTANKNVTANFTAVTYSITATANPIAGGSINCSPNPVASGADANCTATPNTGYALSNFSGDCGGTTCVLTNVTADKTVTANFTAVTYSITATANPIAGGSISCSPNPVASGADANCTATPNTGYALSSFSGDCSGATCALTNVTANKNVTANFAASTYSITATANPTAGGSINCLPNPVASGAMANCTPTANSGYTFIDFSGDCNGATCALTNVTANKNVTANFAENTYSITATANPSAGGSISCSPNPVAFGTDANCTATANSGYALSNFSGDCNGATCVLTNVTAAKAVTANFTPLYSITATANPIAGGSISCSPNPVISGNTANCTATTNTGYTFANFSGDCTGSTCALTNVTTNKNVTANFTATYSITATANPTAGGSISCSPNPVTSGNTANCTATPNTGYTFANFSGDCSGATCVLTNVTTNKNVTANFTATYSITATANPTAGGSISCSPNPVTSGNTANCTATPNTGYTFANFSGDCSGATCVLTNVTANKTVTANFTATYSITATANPTASGSISCSPNPVTSGNTANCTATPNTGYTFANFSGDCTGSTCVLTNVTTNKNVTANFTAVTYSITATANPTAGGSISCSPNPVASGADANCTATPNAGYALSNFSGDCSGTTCVLTHVTAAKAVTANFTPLYSITATANPSAGGSISCSPNPVTSGNTANCTATPNTGYTFVNFSGDCTGSTCVLTNVTANKTVTANFTATYSINATANPIAGGSISCSPNPVASGADANCTATPNTGYTFANFSGDCTGSTCVLTNVTANKTVTANFTATYSITATANPTAGGSISCSPNPVASGADANCTATPNTGYTFANFSGDCTGSTCVLTNVTANKTVTANFTATYSITATANPTAGGSISCSPNPVASGADANCTATPNVGYALTNFSDDCSGATCVLNNVTANKNVTANFTAVTYSITATANPSAGGSISCSPNPVAFGTDANCTATPNTGYALSNFSGDCSGTTCVLNNVTAAKAVTANFTPLYSITATANPIAGGSISCLPNPVASGADANCAATPNVGYIFADFSGDCSGITCALTNVTANKNVTANFTAVTYSITTTANPIAGGLISCLPNPVASGADANCTATPNAGYALSNFSGDCSSTTCLFTNVIANKTVTANFTLNTYSITATANPTVGGSVSCSPNPVTSDDTANCTATPNAGYTFTNFSDDCSGTTCAFSNVTANKTVTANFTAISTYSITATANPSAGGTVNCSPNPVTSGNTTNCTATPNVGYTFNSFSGDCSGTKCALTNVTANKTVTANFTVSPPTVKTYKLLIDKTGSGTITSDGLGINCGSNCIASFNEGTAVTLTATPAAGETFIRWSNCDSVNAAKQCVVTLVRTKLISATFTANVAPIADFVITDITLSPLQPNAGSAFNAAITVKNQGTTAMSGGTLSVWGDLPTGKNCGATSTVKTAIGVLSANETKTFTVSLPPMTSGNKRLRVFADSTCGTYEANERNNQSFLDYRVE
ncbi:InlB B-repeat-containing protein [Chromatium okenii]|uniref:Bacterial repeat domain-containing protein n=1 Tax=Chromatium okenii TaxID=61644 RepID=A0A2S7XUY2_9GAMM|nr:CARDB domain-containing protein [Chromatium okenii]PQJ97192.1 hypothetical protein CXB77_04400 [Chromatium okenii]